MLRTAQTAIIDDYDTPLSYHALKSLGDPGAAIARARESAPVKAIDWSGCGLAQAYGQPGYGPNQERKLPRRR